MARRVPQVTVSAVLLLLPAVGCGGAADEDAASTAPAPPRPAVTAAAQDGDAETQDGLVEVAGHRLAISCRGAGSPTIVYLHGMGGSAGSAGKIPDLLADEHRVCTYDRLNSAGLSDRVEGPLTGTDSVEDLHGLLAAADVPGPYVLLGASFGGLLADMYAATHPEAVAGMVLLDSPLADTFKYQLRYIPKADRPKPDDWKASPERMDELTTFRQAQALQGDEPDVPVTYIAAKDLELPPNYPREAIVAADRKMQRTFLRRFSPGRLVLVDSPHFMEPAIPERIAQEVERVVAASVER